MVTIRCRGCRSPVPLSLSFPGTWHGAPAPRGPWVTQLRLHAARRTSTEDYSGGNKQTKLSPSLSDRHRRYTEPVMKPLMAPHTPPQWASWSSGGVLDCVKDIMGQIEMMWWASRVSVWLTDRCCLSGERPCWWLSPGEEGWGSCGSWVFRLECWQVYYWSLFFYQPSFYHWMGGVKVW